MLWWKTNLSGKWPFLFCFVTSVSCQGALAYSQEAPLLQTRVSSLEVPWPQIEKVRERWQLRRHWVRYKAVSESLSSTKSLRYLTEWNKPQRTSSNNVGSIFRLFRPSENLLRTFVRPFMKEIFSSRVLAVKLDRSKKFRVEIGRDEKKGSLGKLDGVGLPLWFRVTRDRRRAVRRLLHV